MSDWKTLTIIISALRNFTMVSINGLSLLRTTEMAFSIKILIICKFLRNLLVLKQLTYASLQ